MSGRVQRTFKPDALVVCNDGCVQAHSIVLSSIFGYFRTYYNTTMQTDKEIRIDFSQKSFLHLTSILFYQDIDKYQPCCKDIIEMVRCAEFLIASNEDIINVIFALLHHISDKEHKSLGGLVPMYPKIICTMPQKFPVIAVMELILRDPSHNIIKKICDNPDMCYKIWKIYGETIDEYKKIEINYNKILKKAIENFTMSEVVDYYVSKMQSFVMAHDINPCNELIDNAYVLSRRIRKLIKNLEGEEKNYLVKLHEILITISDIDFDSANDNLHGYSSDSDDSDDSESE